MIAVIDTSLLNVILIYFEFNITTKYSSSSREYFELFKSNLNQNFNPIRHDEAAGEVVRSRLQFVDLASGENSVSASRQLSLLEHVLIALSSNGRDHVPYRQCRLTHSLQRALDQRLVYF